MVSRTTAVNLNLTGQSAKAAALAPYLVLWKAELDKRRALWNRLSPAQRKRWVNAAEAKDPLFDLFVQFVRYSRTWEVDADGD